MKKIGLLFLSCWVALSAAAQGGRVYDELVVKSKILGMEKKFAIYLPEDYETSQRAYPVLYLLHGSGDNQTGWVQFGNVKYIADKAISDGIATPMIIVMPDADKPYRGYFNHISGNYNFEDFFFQELIPHIEKSYRTRTEKRYRAIGGLSMGGGGTLVYALHRPDLFAAACPLSAAVRDVHGSSMAEWFTKNVPGVTKEQALEWYKPYDILSLIEQMPEDKVNEVRWYVDCGDDDFLSEGNAMLQIAMLRKKIPHEFRVRDGAHNWEYWRTALPEVLRFVTKSFQQ